VSGGRGLLDGGHGDLDGGRGDLDDYTLVGEWVGSLGKAIPSKISGIK
jgi:hypothetical protein